MAGSRCQIRYACEVTMETWPEPAVLSPAARQQQWQGIPRVHDEGAGRSRIQLPHKADGKNLHCPSIANEDGTRRCFAIRDFHPSHEPLKGSKLWCPAPV